MLDEEEFNFKPNTELVRQIVELKSQLKEAEETIYAIQSGEIDAIVTHDSTIYTLEGADHIYREFVQEMSEGVATLTSNGTIFYGNAKLASMMQIPLEIINGRKLNDFIHPDDLETFQTIFERGLKGSSKGEINIKSADGTIIPVLISIKTSKDLKGVYAVITDLSIQKHHEELEKTQDELLDINKKLEEEKNHKRMLLDREHQLTEKLHKSNDELQSTARELQESNKELMRAQENLEELIAQLKISNKELEQFAYVASHDLQEPLRMVTSFTQLLERRYKGKLDADAEDYIEFIVEGSQRMKDLIDDLLVFSRLKTQVQEFESVSVEIILDDVLSNLKTSIKENDVKITYDPLPTLMGDPFQIMQLFQNLISNAIKFHGDEQPQIHISARKSGDKWLFAVNDNGIGIDPEHQEYIFNIFRRLHTRDEYEGTGIGLSICKKIVERHGGQIWVESELEKGSTFYFTLLEDG